MKMRTTLGAAFVLGLAGAGQVAAAQTPASDAGQTQAPAPEHAAVTVLAVESATPPQAAAREAPMQAEAAGAERCRWRRAERRGLSRLFIPLDICREGLSALRRGVSC